MDQNTKEIIHFWLIFHEIFCFGHNFWTDAIFSNQLSQVIYIFPVLCIDTIIGRIHGHMKPCNKDHYGHFVDIDHYGLAHFGHRFDRYWCLFEEQEKCRSTVKAELKNMHRFKSYGQNKIDYEIMIISFVFWAYFWPKMTTLEAALPMGPQR